MVICACNAYLNGGHVCEVTIKDVFAFLTMMVIQRQLFGAEEDFDIRYQTKVATLGEAIKEENPGIAPEHLSEDAKLGKKSRAIYFDLKRMADERR